jgi:hypothetical protein
VAILSVYVIGYFALSHFKPAEPELGDLGVAVRYLDYDWMETAYAPLVTAERALRSKPLDVVSAQPYRDMGLPPEVWEN